MGPVDEVEIRGCLIVSRTSRSRPEIQYLYPELLGEKRRIRFATESAECLSAP